MRQREQAAQTTDRWIDILARELGLHRLALLRLLPSRALLAREVALLIVRSATAEGDRLFDAAEDAAEGATLSDRITRAQWARRERAYAAEWERDTTPNEDDARATAAGFAALRAMRTEAGEM